MKYRPKPSETMAGGYVLHGLTPEEEAEFERLLAKSESLRAEVTELRDTAVLLGDSLPDVVPPDYLKVRIMAQIHNTPQLPATGAELPNLGKSQRRFATLRSLSAAFGAAALIGAIVVGVNAMPQQAAAPANTVVAIQKASDSRTARVAAADVANSVSVVWSNTQHRAAVRLNGADLASNRDLQLWIVDSKNHSIDAGVMGATTAEGWYLLNGQLKAGDSIAATIEPKGGSKHPTTKPVFVVTA